ncbi:tetratricopeptide repeat protein [Myxococcaceae bacterium JPH2]|nr:tetratricopeptide repeat protein [Myxococcaceae bacterium JPH2]
MKRVLALAVSLGLGLPMSALGAESVRVQILSATVKDQTIAGAEVILQKNGEASVQGSTAADGTVRFEKPFGGLDDSGVSLIVKKDGYSNLVARCPCNGLTYAVSPVMTQNLDGMRIVLNWGAKPADLDSHLVHPSTHVFFSKKKGDLANLDVDDTTSYGPETITLEKKKPGVKYLYAVHNYTEGDAQGSTTLSNASQAKVFVYVGSSLVRTFTPPQGKAGNVWVVFGIGDNGEFYDINKFTDVSDRSKVGDFMQGLISGEGFKSVPEVSSDQVKLADKLNRQGEQAYHAKKLDEAVALYLEAIANNPEHGQAYSNLGLAYQKLDRSAEALWANRKAIALASGPNANTIQASSFYNIARVYESQSQWSDALENYQAALGKKEHPAYRSGIEKMKQKLGQP